MPATLTRSTWQLALAILLPIAFAEGPAAAQRPRALPEGQLPGDVRLGDLKDLNGYFPFVPPEDDAQWERRAEEVRRRALVSQGLWPIPERSELQAVIHGRLEGPGYTIEKAYFQALPGFYVTGSLYRPAEASGKRPGVLCPHGHWSNGRFHDAGQGAARQAIESGAEERMSAARSPLQARCVQLARMGCVVFHYDMIGYADSTQLSFQLAHRFAKQRPAMNDSQDWGLFSPQAEARLQSIMGLQTWSSIRALDFLASLPDVDPDRLAVTGASGGGTQTFMLGAVDPRLAAAVPAVMVSTAMQGGCTCENACCLRIGTGNVELAALFAPKPLGLTAANDWTKEMETKGFPELQAHYRRLGAADHVQLWANIQFGHNYNAVSRKAMYGWFNQHLKLGLQEPIEEADFPFRTAEELTVWDDQHPRPAGGEEAERQVVRWWTRQSQQSLERLAIDDAPSLQQWQGVVGPAIDTLIGRGLPDAGDLEYEQTDKRDRGSYLQMVGLLRDKAREESSPMLFLYPKQWRGQVVIWLDDQGKAGLLDDNGQPIAPVQRLLGAGSAVAGIDLLYQGEFLQPGQTMDQTRRVENPREAAAYTFGYNHTLLARRVHDALKLVAYVEAHEYQPKAVCLVGWEGAAGVWAAAARAQAGDVVDKAVIHTRAFRFAHVADIHSPQFLPGGAKYQDLPGMLALAAPAPLWLAGEGRQAPPLVQDAYQAAEGEATAFEGPDEQGLEAAVQWLLKQ